MCKSSWLPRCRRKPEELSTYRRDLPPPAPYWQGPNLDTRWRPRHENSTRGRWRGKGVLRLAARRSRYPGEVNDSKPPATRLWQAMQDHRGVAWHPEIRGFFLPQPSDSRESTVLS